MYKKIQKKLQRFGIWLEMLLIFCCVYIQQTYAAENENAIEDARNAIVEIQSVSRANSLMTKWSAALS